MTTEDVLQAAQRLGVAFAVRDGRLYQRAPTGVLTPALRDALRQQQAALVALLEPATPLISLKGGLVVPAPALRLALCLEARDFTLTLDADHQIAIDPAARLTAADRVGISRWRAHLGAIVAYRCPSEEFPQ